VCDEDTLQEENAYLARAKLSRRQFNTLAAGVALTSMLPPLANAMEVVEKEVKVTTPDGIADCYLVHPAKGKHPAVLVWPDIVGLRPAFKTMGRRLAESGYVVLVVNPYYRNAAAPVVPEGASFSDPDTRALLMPMYRAITPETNVTDAKAFVSFLDAQAMVDSSRKIGTTGYCMGGPMVMRTAAALPDRIGAGASFHGASLVNESAASPHRLIPDIKANMLIAIAENDDERQPEAKTVLKAEFDKTDVIAEIEVYKDTMHGWCALDSRVYHQAQADKAWERLLNLFEKSLV